MKEFSFIHLLFGGGWFLTLISLILIALSIYSWAVMIEKFLLFRNIVKHNGFLRDMKHFNYNTTKLYNKYKDAPNQTGYSRIFLAAYNLPKEKLYIFLPNIVEKELQAVESKTGFLSNAAAVAPFIGLFGTVWGVMDVFSSIGVHGSTSLQVVAPGVGAALSTTALGLIVAIPAAFGGHLFNEKYDELEAKVYRFADDIQEMLLRSKAK
ncbi:MAG: MotA/TolQ/ExbB proton channel family protein [Rickettsiales bacterium]|jgi:biopolymer transport protein TolQ|nr:MotA/TolQ/ExbB proton channel family protein [Rickettsiales bacterium]